MIYSLTVTKNESDRYLKQVLSRLNDTVDISYVYDDQSTDNTIEVALGEGSYVRIRANNKCSFEQDEAQFRSEALQSMVRDINVKPGDWILSVDADEILYTDDSRTPREFLHDLTTDSPFHSWKFPIKEVFDIGNMGTPYIRVDGYWGSIDGVRLFQYDGTTSFRSKGMGCGSVPTKFNKKFGTVKDMGFVHYGYAKQEDRVAKYARYFGVPGHSVKHVDSILRPPVVVRWDGSYINA